MAPKRGAKRSRRRSPLEDGEIVSSDDDRSSPEADQIDDDARDAGNGVSHCMHLFETPITKTFYGATGADCRERSHGSGLGSVAD